MLGPGLSRPGWAIQPCRICDLSYHNDHNDHNDVYMFSKEAGRSDT